MIKFHEGSSFVDEPCKIYDLQDFVFLVPFFFSFVFLFLGTKFWGF